MAYDRALEDKLLAQFEDGGVVEDDAEQGVTLEQATGAPDPDITGSVPEPEQGLTFEQLQSQGMIGEDKPDAEKGLTFEQLQKMGAVAPDEAPDEAPEPEGMLATAGRSAIHYAPAAAAALPAMAAGATLGAAAGAPFAGVGSIPGAAIGGFLGGLAGALGAGWAVSEATDWVLDKLGMNDREQRAANAEENPVSDFAGNVLPGIAGFGVRGASLAARGVNAVVGGGLEAVQNAVHEGELSPWKILGSAAAGGVWANPNRLGERLMKPGQNVGEFLRDKYQATRAAQTNNGTATAPPSSPTPTPPSTPIPVSGSARAYPKAATPAPVAPTLPNGVAPDALAALDGAFGKSGLTGKGFDPNAAAPAPALKGQVVDTGIVEAGIVEAGAEQSMFNALPASVPERVPHVDTGFPEPHGTVDYDGLKINIENLAGETRKGTGPEGDWEVKMPVPYGEIEGTRGADGDKVDAFLGPHQESTRGVIIEQRDLKTGKFDEHKVMLGFDSGADAIKAYTDSFSDGKGAQRIGTVHEAPMSYIKNWLQGDTRKPLVSTPEVKTIEAPKLPKVKKPRGPAQVQREEGTPYEASAKTAEAEGWEAPRGEADFGDAAIAAAEKAEPSMFEAPTSKSKIIPAKPGRKRGPMLDFGEGDGVTATVKPKALTDAIADLHANGYERLAAKVEAMPDHDAALAATKMARRKAGLVKAPPKVEGLEVTARSKADAERKAKAVSTVQEAFDKFVPESDQIPTDKKGITALRTRLLDGIAHAETGKDAEGKLYKPKQTNAAYEWLAAARSFINSGQAPSQIRGFLAAEKQLRSGKTEDMENVRATKRIKADSELRRGPTVDEATDAHAQKSIFELPADDPDAGGITRDVRSADDLVQESLAPKVAPDGRRVLPDLSNAPKAKRLVQQEASPEAKAARDAQVAEQERLRAEIETRSKEQEAKTKPSTGRKLELTEEAKLQALASLDRAKAKAASRDAPRPTPTVGDFIADEKGAGRIFEKLDAALNRNSVKSAQIREKKGEGYIAKDAGSKQETFARSEDDNLHRLDQADVEHITAQKKTMDALPAEFKNDALQEKLYLAREADELHTLTPDERAAYDKHLKEVFDENDLLFTNIEAVAPKLLGESVDNHTMRIRRGYTPTTDFQGASKGRDPVITPGMNTGKKIPMYDRLFMALERADGKRVVVSLNDEGDGITAWTHHKANPVNTGEIELKAGNIIDVKGQKFLVREAMTPEIEQHANFRDGKPARYYHNALISAYLANHYLASTARHLQHMHELKSDPDFLKLATKDYKKAERMGWHKSTLPQFDRPGDIWYMDDRIRHVLDDYHHAGFDVNNDALDKVRSLSRAITKLIFLIPTAHAANVGAHWFVERGWDWVNPLAYRRLVATGTRAIKSVYTQDNLQSEYRRAGIGTVYGGVATQDPVQLLFTAAGATLTRDPAKWDPIAKTLGVDSRDLVNSIYHQSSKAMWMASDMFLTQAVLENQLRGMSLKQSIVTAEQHIPNYRIPTTIGGREAGGRFFSKLMQDQSAVAFGRYHYGVFNSFAHVVKDLVKGEGPQKIDAMGKLFAMGLLLYAVKPAMDKMWQTLTQDEDAEAAPRGPLAPITHAIKAVKGETDPLSIARGAVTTAPLLATAKETLENRDFAGRNILEPGTFKAAMHGDVRAMGRVFVQEADHAARGLISPYGMVMTGAKKGQNPFEIARDALLDIKIPSDPAKIYKAKLEKTLQQKEISRFRKPPSFAEELYNRATGFR